MLKNWCPLPTHIGHGRMYDTGNENVVVVCFGDIFKQPDKPLLRIHSSCMASEIFGAGDCDCADQLRESMKMMTIENAGIIIYLRQEGRGQGLSKKIQAVNLMAINNLDTVQAYDFLDLKQDIRKYDDAIQILKYLDLKRVRLISNNPRKIKSLEENGIDIEMINTHPNIRQENEAYLHSKNQKLGHCLPLDENNNNDTIEFYHSDQPWGELSNFSQHAVYLYEQIWPTVEHFYQAQKFPDAEQVEQIRRASSPTLAKQRAHNLQQHYLRDDWKLIKEKIMREGLHAKFTQHPDLRDKLLSSDDCRLVEHTHQDAYWGDGAGALGLNRLGVLLMELRSLLKTDAVLS